MISEKMRPLVENNSVIRVMFEEGKRLAAIYGAENVLSLIHIYSDIAYLQKIYEEV